MLDNTDFFSMLSTNYLSKLCNRTKFQITNLFVNITTGLAEQNHISSCITQ